MFSWIVIGVASGLHAASYGAYKDSPYEKFYWPRYVREILLSLLIAGVLVYIFPSQTNPGILFLTTLLLSRLGTEVYKLFLRNEPQTRYRIPSMAHVSKKVVTSGWLRLALAGFIVTIAFILTRLAHILALLPHPLSGATIGTSIGLAIAMGGAHKDGYFEGFSPVKFCRSPAIAAVSGMFVAGFTREPALILFAAGGLERILVEAYKTFYLKSYVPGKFKAVTPPYPKYLDLRKILLLPYSATWMILFLALSG